MILKSYTKFLDAHMTQCELDSGSGFRGAWLTIIFRVSNRVYKSLTSRSIWGVVSHLNIAKISKHYYPSEYFSNCDNISKILFSNQSFQQTLNKIAYYIPFNENFILCHLFVSGPYVLGSSYNGIFDDPVLDIKNENYLFLRFYLLLLDCDYCRSFDFNLILMRSVWM